MDPLITYIGIGLATVPEYLPHLTTRQAAPGRDKGNILHTNTNSFCSHQWLKLLPDV